MRLWRRDCVKEVARAGAVADVLVAGGGVERSLEPVPVLLTRLVGAERDVAVLVRERSEIERAVVGVAAGGRDLLGAIRAVPDRVLPAVDDADHDLRREWHRVVAA